MEKLCWCGHTEDSHKALNIVSDLCIYCVQLELELGLIFSIRHPYMDDEKEILNAASFHLQEAAIHLQPGTHHTP